MAGGSSSSGCPKIYQGVIRWAGLGLALIAAIGILYFKEPVSVQRMVFIGLILVGVIGLSLSGVRGSTGRVGFVF